MKHLYFIRHGESEFNKAHKWVGSTDAPLTKKGHEQAQKAGLKLKKEGLTFDRIITSPSERAYKTAEHVAEALGYPVKKIHINERLVERDFGSLEGKKQLVAATKYTFDESAIDHHDKVESLSDFQARVDKFLEYLHTLPDDNILLVGHGAFGRALWRAVHGHPLSKRSKVYRNGELEKLI